MLGQAPRRIAGVAAAVDELEAEDDSVTVGELGQPNAEELAAVLVVFEGHAAQDLEVLDRGEDQVRAGRFDGAAEELDHQGDRQHGLTLDPVMIDGGEGALVDEHVEARRVPMSTGVRRQRLGPRLAAEHELDRVALVHQLVHQHLRAGFEGDQRHAEALEVLLEGGRDHAAFPRAPAEAPREKGSAARSLLGVENLVQGLVRHRVVALAAVAAATRDRREGDEHREGIVRRRVEERRQASYLGVEDAREVLHALVRDEAVGDETGAMDDAGDRGPTRCAPRRGRRPGRWRR